MKIFEPKQWVVFLYFTFIFSIVWPFIWEHWLLFAICLMILTSSLWALDCSNKRNKKSHCPISNDINKIAWKLSPEISIQKCKCILERIINFRKAVMLFSICADIKFWIYRKRVGREVDDTEQLLYGPVSLGAHALCILTPQYRS